MAKKKATEKGESKVVTNCDNYVIWLIKNNV